MLTKRRVANRVWVIEGDTQVEIAKAFIRFQEFYENPDLQGNFEITVRDVEEWWQQTKQKDDESYYVHWVGFNLPGRVFVEAMTNPYFRPGFSLKRFLTDPFQYPRYHKEEDELLALVCVIPILEIIGSYFIGMWKDSKDVFDHEFAHGLFATNATYRSEQMYNLSKLPKGIYEHIRTQHLDDSHPLEVEYEYVRIYL